MIKTYIKDDEQKAPDKANCQSYRRKKKKRKTKGVMTSGGRR